MAWNVSQFEISAAALEVLQSTTDAKGRALEVFKVPLPPRITARMALRDASAENGVGLMNPI